MMPQPSPSMHESSPDFRAELNRLDEARRALVGIDGSEQVLDAIHRLALQALDRLQRARE